MKVWEYCRDMHDMRRRLLEALGADPGPEYDWEAFARTGDCGGLKCVDCPFSDARQFCDELKLRRVLKRDIL